MWSKFAALCTRLGVRYLCNTEPFESEAEIGKDGNLSQHWWTNYGYHKSFKLDCWNLNCENKIMSNSNLLG